MYKLETWLLVCGMVVGHQTDGFWSTMFSFLVGSANHELKIPMRYFSHRQYCIQFLNPQIQVSTNMSIVVKLQCMNFHAHVTKWFHSMPLFLFVDVVFLRTWYPVDIPQFYNPVTSLLLPADQKTAWSGLRTLGQLRYDKNVKPQFSADSVYKVSVR